MRILLSGMLAGVPGHGGATWAVLQYLLGFRRLGHEVVFVEPVEASGAIARHGDLGRSASGRYFRRLRRSFRLEGCTAMVRSGTRDAYGMEYRDLVSFAKGADLLVNLSGMLRESELVDPIPTRLYLDLDPGFTQLWDAADGIDMGFDRHTHFASVGLELEKGGGPVPTRGRDWVGTLPPVVLDHWPFSSTPGGEAYTSVANWRGYGGCEHQGISYGQKAHSIRELATLPARAPRSVELALAIHPAERGDIELLRRNAWKLVDPAVVANTPGRYRSYLAHSRGELSVAKSGYVVGHTGWFSDRSACYLACGRPVIAQDTGFSRHLPTGQGLLAFGTADEAAHAMESVEADYPAHRRAARSLAERFLDSDVVLSRLLQAVHASALVPS